MASDATLRIVNEASLSSGSPDRFNDFLIGALSNYVTDEQLLKAMETAKYCVEKYS